MQLSMYLLIFTSRLCSPNDKEDVFCFYTQLTLKRSTGRDVSPATMGSNQLLAIVGHLSKDRI